MRNIYEAIWIICLCFKGIALQDTECTNNEEIGENDPKDEKQLTNTDTYYLLCDGNYKIDCCGVLSFWEYGTDNPNSPLTLYMWRPAGTDSYSVITSTTHTATSKKDNVAPSPGRYLIRPDDCIGWHASGADIVDYKDSGAGNSGTAKTLAAGSVDTSGVVDWSAPTGSYNDEWQIMIELDPPSKPVFDSTTVGSVDNGASTGFTVGDVSFSDADLTDSLTLTITDAGDLFEITDNGDNTGSISVKNDLMAATGAYTVQVTATDLCGYSVTETLNIKIENISPVLTCTLTEVSIHEDVKEDNNLINCTCTDTSSVTVSLSELPTHTNPPYFFEKLLAADVYGVFVRSQLDTTQGQFDYHDRSHTVKVSCTDSFDTVSEDLTIILEQNQAPNITNIPATGASVNVSADEATGTVLFKLVSFDEEGDTIYYNWTVTPSFASCPLVISDTGDLILDGSFDLSTALCQIEVTPVDHRNDGQTKTIAVIVSGANSDPTFSNMDNARVCINEGTLNGTLVFTVSASDVDGDMLTLSWSDSGSGTTYFNLDSTSGEVITIGDIDYETMDPEYNFTVTATDGRGGTVTSTLAICINDKNEAMHFTSAIYRVDILEWTAVDTIIATDISIIDSDVSDTHTVLMDCGTYNGYYQMDPTTRNLTVKASYKLDDGVLPTSFTCDLNVTDTGGNVDYASFIFDIGYDNNYTPTFYPDIYYFSVSETATIDTFIGTVTATDDDLVEYNDFTYSFPATPAYFKINGSSGEISTIQSMDSCNCSGVNAFVVQAIDSGGRTGTATVYITVTDVITTTSAPDRYKTMWDDSRTYPWVISLALVLVATVFVTPYVCVKYVCNAKCCRNPCARRRFDWKPRRAEREYRRRPSPRQPRGTANELSVRRPPGGAHGWEKYNHNY